jgi:L-rhamnose mutarotase
MAEILLLFIAELSCCCLILDDDYSNTYYSTHNSTRDSTRDSNSTYDITNSTIFEREPLNTLYEYSTYSECSTENNSTRNSKTE